MLPGGAVSIVRLTIIRINKAYHTHRQAGLTIGPNQTALSSQIDHGARGLRCMHGCMHGLARPGARKSPPLPPWGWWRAHTGWAEPQDDPGPGQRALADQGGGGAARSCVTIKMLTKYAFGACGSTACCSRPPSLKLRHSSAGHRGAASGRALWRA
jgi:hypothetical protein